MRGQGVKRLLTFLLLRGGGLIESKFPHNLTLLDPQGTSTPILSEIRGHLLSTHAKPFWSGEPSLEEFHFSQKMRLVLMDKKLLHLEPG